MDNIKYTEDNVEYIGFFRRITASILDMALITVVVIRIVEYLYINVLYKDFMSNLSPELKEFIARSHSGEILTQEEQLLFYQQMFDSGLFSKMLHLAVTEYIVVGFVIFFFWSRFLATPGKMLFKAIIVDASTYEPASTKQLILRYIGYILSALPFGLGFMWIAFDKRNQGFHDKFAHTVVISKNILDDIEEEEQEQEEYDDE